MEKILIGAFAFLMALKLTHTWDVSWWVVFSVLSGLFINTYEVVKIKKDKDA